MIGPSTFGFGRRVEPRRTTTAVSLTSRRRRPARRSPRAAVKEATPDVFRVVSGDYIQGPQDAKFMIKKGAKNVVVFDFQEPYSQGLAAAAEAVFKAGNVTVTHLSVANTVTDFSSFVTKVPSNADFVFFPDAKPADAQNFAQQLLEQGKKAKVFGGDGASVGGAFKVPGSYVSRLLPGHQHDSVQQAASSPGGRRTTRSSSSARSAAARTSRSRSRSTPSSGRATSGKGQIKDRRDVVTQRQADLRQELDPRRRLPLLDEVERPAERRRSTSSRSSRTARTRTSQRPSQLVSSLGAARLGRAALACSSALDSRASWTRFIQLTLNGLTLGSVYALIALGYSLVYGILKLLNFAHGDVFMVGTFIGFGVLQLLGGAATRSSRSGRCSLITLAAMVGCAVARGRDRAVRLPAAARRAADRSADQRARRLVLPRVLDAAAVRRGAQELRHVLDVTAERSTSTASTSATSASRSSGSS